MKMKANTSIKTETSIEMRTSPKPVPRLRTACASSLLLPLLLAPPSAAQVPFDYTTNDGTITITGYTGSGGSVSIPSTIGGLPVTAIGGSYDSSGLWFGAFFGCTGVGSVAIPSSVTNITAGALVEAESAFDASAGISAITVDAANPYYSSVAGVLFDKNLSVLIACPGAMAGSYTIPDSVSSVEHDAFTGCSALTDLTIPDSVTNIGSAAFSNCPKLASVTLPDGLTSVQDGLFNQCYGLTNVTIPNAVTSIGGSSFYDCYRLGGVTIPNSVTNVGDKAFEFGGGLTSLLIGNSVTSIGQFAFTGCSNLTSVTFPSSLTSIGIGAFFECSNLTSVYFEGNAPNIVPSGLIIPNVFSGNHAVLYYLPGATGWGPTFGGLPTALWNPQVQTSNARFGTQGGQFGSPSPAPATWPSWSRPARVWPIPPGSGFKPTPSPVARPISATPSGRIIPAVSTASAGREARDA